MASIADAIAALERRLGFLPDRSKTIARRLQEAGMLQSGAPGVTPHIELDEFVALVMARSIDPVLHVVADSVRVFGAMTPGGASLVGAPAHIPTARQRLECLADMAIGDADQQRHVAESAIEFVTGWPEIVISGAGVVERFREVGALPDRWDSGKHRCSTTLNGAAFGQAVRDLFGERR